MTDHGYVVVGQVTLAVYAVLLGLGGAMGFVKAHSRTSLVAGSASALLALGSLLLTWLGGLGFWSGAILALMMAIVFAVRLAKTRKFMPAGMLLLISLVVLVLMERAIAHLR